MIAVWSGNIAVAVRFVFTLFCFLLLLVMQTDEKFNAAIVEKVESTIAGFSPSSQDRVAGMLKGTLLSISDLLAVHWKQIDDLLMDDEKLRGTFSLSVKLDVGDKQSKVLAKISYAKRTSDSVEIPINNPTERADD